MRMCKPPGTVRSTRGVDEERLIVPSNLDEFTEFVAARSSALLRTACLLTAGDRQRAEDLLQEAFVETYKRWSRIKDPGARELYLRRILVRSASRGWRSRRRMVEVSYAEPPDTPIPGWTADSSSLRIDIDHFLAALSPKQRAVIVLRYYEDLSEAGIATLLGCAPGTVKSHASRGLRALERAMGSTHATDRNTNVMGAEHHDA